MKLSESALGEIMEQAGLIVEKDSQKLRPPNRIEYLQAYDVANHPYVRRAAEHHKKTELLDDFSKFIEGLLRDPRAS